ncbi:HAD family phosphatase [Tropicimonas sp. IMCC34043]|uniref:HAD family hydrolase n=1 Tax=Tropicimonas sp. IMCC34043 TaxID=2248760 RepID=UPI000E22F59A|nr:HAD family phosphatase [Tropicimonas sp. IMCC34043]
MDRPQAVIFDLDGCLVDSEPMSLEALAAEMRASGVAEATSAAMRDRYLGVSATDVSRHLAARLGRPCPPDFIDNYHRRLYAAYEAGIPRIEAMVEVLDRLQSEGIATCIASGGSPDRIRRTLAAADLTERFGTRIFSAEQVAHGKPAPDLVLLAARELGVEPARCVVVEDSPHGIRGAMAAGMRGVGFTGGTHLDGIRDSHASALYAAGAEAVREDASELLAIILGQGARNAAAAG